MGFRLFIYLCVNKREMEKASRLWDTVTTDAMIGTLDSDHTCRIDINILYVHLHLHHVTCQRANLELNVGLPSSWLVLLQ